MNTADKIKNQIENMTNSEHQIALYFPSHVHDFAFLTLDRLAEKTCVSTTSVIRFCRKLGFSGFRDFQEALRKDIRYQPDLPVKFKRTKLESEGDVLLTRTMEQSIRCIQETFQSYTQPQLDDTVAALEKARRIYTFGMKESYALSHYLYTRLITVREDVCILNAGYNAEIESVLNLKPDDVCIVFLFHRYTKQTLSLLPLIKQQGAQVILITSPPFGEVEDYADYILPCCVDSGSIKNTSVAAVCLCDYLCNALAMRLGDSALAHMQQTESLFSSGSMIES